MPRGLCQPEGSLLRAPCRGADTSGLRSVPVSPRAQVGPFLAHSASGAPYARSAPLAVAAFNFSAPRCFFGSFGNFAAGRVWGSLGTPQEERAPIRVQWVTGGRCVCVSGRWSSPLASRNALAGIWKARGSVNSSCPLGLSEPGAAGRREPRSPGRGAQHMGRGCPPPPLLPKASVRVPALTTTPTPTSGQSS